DFVKTIDVPTSVDRSQGDIHPQGNPHIHLDPRNIAIVAKEVTKRLQQIDPENKATYVQNQNQFLNKWNASIQNWQQRLNKLSGKNIIVHHTNWSYFVKWANLKQVATLEPVPGMPPTVSHLESLLQQV